MEFSEEDKKKKTITKYTNLFSGQGFRPPVFVNDILTTGPRHNFIFFDMNADSVVNIL